MPCKNTTSSIAIIALIDLLLSRGVPLSAISDETGISPDVLKHSDVRITVRQLDDLWQLAISESGDNALGLRLRKDYGRDTMHFVSIIARNSLTIYEAVTHWCRFAPLICEPVRVDMRKEDDIYIVSYSNVIPGFQCNSMVEHDFTSMLYFARKFSGQEINPVEVHFRHDDPGYIEHYEAYFRCPVRFNQVENAFFFYEKTMLATSETRNKHLQAVLKKHAETQILKYTEKDNLITAVEEFISIHIARGELDIRAVCTKLNMSRSTLYRKLKEQGLTFSGLLKRTRKKLALSYLKQEMNTTQIAYLLGFTDPSVFHHAFKRWHGESIGAFRKRLRSSENQ